MIEVKYKITIKSSLIISPRSDRAFYRDLDNSIEEKCIKDINNKCLNYDKLKIIYPFYRYGIYDSYSPEKAEYYIPGTSVKGALTNPVGKRTNKDIKLMVDDIKINNDMIVLRNLYKIQYINDPGKKTVLKSFFDNVGVEMVKGSQGNGTLTGKLYTDSMETVKDLLENANSVTKKKMERMVNYLKKIKKDIKENNTSTEKTDDGNDIQTVINNLNNLTENKSDKSKIKEEYLLFLGGYKGLINSICLNENKAIDSAVFIDCATMLPHGLVSINLSTENNEHLID